MIYHETDGGVSRMSADDLDAIALGGGVAGSCSTDSCHGALPQGHHGWKFHWVHTHGTGNQGDIVLTPLTPRNRAIWVEGKIRLLLRVAPAGTNRLMAERIILASKGICYGMELQVQLYVLKTMSRPGCWKTFPGVGNGVWSWYQREKMPPCDLSAPRLAAAHAIVMNMLA